MRGTRGPEAWLARALLAGARGLSWQKSLAAGARLGDLARTLGLRRRVAVENLAHAFPGWSEGERSALLAAHYRELGRVSVEYARLGELAAAPPGEVVAGQRGLEHLERAIQGGRGAVLVGGHFGNFELSGAMMARLHPVAFVVRPLANPRVEAMIRAQRSAAGVGEIPADTGVRQVYQSLRANRWVAMLADQDARQHGVFVPFLGRAASTAIGPARIALATGAPIVMGFIWRQADGRHVIEVDPPLEIADPEAPDAAFRLTALHTRRLEERVRERPEQWFWLHRRWKTAPPRAGAGEEG